MRVFGAPARVSWVAAAHCIEGRRKERVAWAAEASRKTRKAHWGVSHCTDRRFASPSQRPGRPQRAGQGKDAASQLVRVSIQTIIWAVKWWSKQGSEPLCASIGHIKRVTGSRSRTVP